MAERKKAPANTYWRGDTLHYRFAVAGTPFRGSLRTSDVAVARRRVAEKIAKAKAEVHFGEVRRSWLDAVAEWAPWIAKNIGPRTAARYATSIMVAKPHLQGYDIHSIGKPEIAAFITARAQSGVSNATIRRDLTAISSVLEYACDQDWREGNPARERAKKLEEKRDPFVLPPDESIARVMSRILSQPGWHAMALAARLTGARMDELRNMMREDFNRNAATLAIRKGKGNKGRVIDLTPAAVKHLDSLTPSLTTKSLFHENGEPMGDMSSRWRSNVMWAAAEAKRAGVEFTPFRFHDLRHIYAIEYLKGGGSLYDLQQQLGHSSIKTTEGYLAHLSPDQKKRAIAARKA